MTTTKIDALGGVLMLLALILALLLANTTDYYTSFLASNLSFLGPVTLSVKDFIQEALMILFFIYVGMELNYEFAQGFLQDKKQITLPLLAAFGGMLIPALLYWGCNYHSPENSLGFAIPCATDIAFALCLFNLMGTSLPASMRTLLLSIAIFDDLGAILLIAGVYSQSFVLAWALATLILIALLWYCGKHKYQPYLYLGLSLALCGCAHSAGINLTFAGFLIGFCLPLHYKKIPDYLHAKQQRLHPWVQWLILPVFAFSASGIQFERAVWAQAFSPLVVGVFLGLFVGKQVGVTLFARLALSCKWAILPKGSSFADIYTLSIFTAIGFTMSLFIGFLAFPLPLQQNAVKLAVLSSSLCSAIWIFLVTFLRKRAGVK